MRRNAVYRLGFLAFIIFAVQPYVLLIVPHLVANFFRADFQQDYIGALALLNRNHELYPILGPAFAQMGLDWNVLHRSTHLPTAFLLVLPFVLFNYRAAQFLWMAAMFACIVLTARVLGLTWKRSILAGALSLAWPPTIFSLVQFTPIWLLGLAMAYRYRRHALKSGAYIALASLPKFLAASALLYHLRRRQWSALIGFGALCLGALAFLLLLRPDTIAAYFTSNIGNSIDQINRSDNGALVVVAWRLGGWIGLVAVAALILWVFWSAIRRDGPAEWACLVWLGIAFLPIAWNYSLLPLLPWLVLVLMAPRASSGYYAGAALILPYAAAIPTQNPVLVAMSIAFSGVAFARASEREIQETSDYLEARVRVTDETNRSQGVAR